MKLLIHIMKDWNFIHLPYIHSSKIRLRVNSRSSALDVIENHFYFYDSVNCTKGLRAILLASFSMPSSSSWLVVEPAQRAARGLNLPIDPVQWIRALSRASIRNVLTSFARVSSFRVFFLNVGNTSSCFHFNNIFNIFINAICRRVQTYLFEKYISLLLIKFFDKRIKLTIAMCFVYV